MSDVIDQLAGIEAGSALERARAARPAARSQAQLAYELLLHPEVQEGAISLAERRAVAVFTLALGDDAALSAHYQALLEEVAPELVAPILEEARLGRGTGPFGRYPEGPLSVEDTSGTVYQASDAGKAALGPRLVAALGHAHLLTLHPRDASESALQALLDAGWTTPGIVTLSQLISFLAFQSRTVAGLRLAVQARAARRAPAKA